MTLQNTQVVTRRSARNLQRLAGIDNPINSGVSQNNSENRCILLGSVTGTENTKSPSRIPNVSNSIYPGSVDGTENTKSPTRIPNVSYNIHSSSVDGTENTKSPTRIPNVSNGATALYSPNSISESVAKSNSPGTHQRGYSLNWGKAWKKKLSACNTEFKVKSTFKGGNYVFEFSAAMYELYRSALVEHFESLQNAPESGLTIQFKDCSDKSGAIVESQLRVLQTPSAKLKYSINLYHTKSKMMVNGGEAFTFNVEHTKIADLILSSEDVNKLDNEFFVTISEGLKSLISNNSKTKSKQLNNTSNLPIVHSKPSRVLGSNKASAHSSEQDVSSECGGDPSPCPNCQILVDVSGIYCDGCENWFHFDCEALNAEDVGRFDCSEDPYYCLSCTQNMQCLDFEDLSQLANERNIQENDPPTDITHNTAPKVLADTVQPDQTYLKQAVVVSSNSAVDITCPKQIATPGRISGGGRQDVTPSPPGYQKSKPPDIPLSNLSNEQSPSSRRSFKRKTTYGGTDEPPNVVQPDQNSKSNSENQVTEQDRGRGSNLPTSMDPAVSQPAEDGAKRNGSRSNRQSKKGEKQKLKDCEQEEQLKLARSLIGNLERKIIELENSNKILRREVLSSSLDMGGVGNGPIASNHLQEGDLQSRSDPLSSQHISRPGI